MESGKPFSDEKLEEIRATTADHQLFQEVMYFTRFDWPEHFRSLKEDCRVVVVLRSELSISDGLLLYRDCIAEVLEIIEDPRRTSKNQQVSYRPITFERK